MGENSAIEWTHHTFNPWWGCEKVSPACAHCYAETFADRFPRTRGLWGPDAPRKVASEKVWNDPIRWNRDAEKARERRRVFCASMADVFEDRRDLDDARGRLWGLIRQTPWLDWLLLTKRPEAAARLVPPSWGPHGWPSNVWVGTTVEDQARAEERIPHLVALPARRRFLSCEPLLGPVSIKALTGCTRPAGDDTCFPAKVSWVIVGGESGRFARPMHASWVRALLDECHAAHVPFFFKQWGEWSPRGADGFGGNFECVDSVERRRVSSSNGGDGQRLENASRNDMWMQCVGKKASGRLLGGRTWDEIPTACIS